MLMKEILMHVGIQTKLGYFLESNWSTATGRWRGHWRACSPTTTTCSRGTSWMGRRSGIAGSEIDASIIYADYYYLEALTRMLALKGGNIWEQKKLVGINLKRLNYVDKFVSDFWCVLEKSGAKNALFRRKTRVFLIKRMLLSSKSYALIEQKHSFYRWKA